MGGVSMQSIISKGKNIEEAIKLGLQLMEASKKDVDIEIIQQETSGFIGIGKKQAVVKLSVKKSKPNMLRLEPSYSKIQSSSLEEVVNEYISSIEKDKPMFSGTVDLDFQNLNNQHSSLEDEPQMVGMAWVKNGEIFVLDSPSNYSTVTIGKGIRLIKNGVVVRESSTVISQKDQLSVQVEESAEKESKWKISIKSHGLHARLYVEPGYRIKRIVKDVEPNEHIDLQVLETREIRNTLTYKDVLQKLNELGVIYGINHQEIMRAINTKETNTFELATGKPVEPGQNGWIDIKVEMNPNNGLIEDENGKVDFRNTNVIPNVDKGSIIATIHPALPGIPGITVTNETIPAKKGVPIIVRAGKGMIEVDGKLVASESGRPSIEQRGQLIKAEIVPKLFHNENVSMASGNINFYGDVEIIGEVEEGMEVEAGGDVIVHKTVSGSTITSMKSILVKSNVVSSSLSAGKSNMLIVELGHLLATLRSDIEHMIVVIRQLTQSSRFKSSDFSINGLQPLIKLLLEKRFKNIYSESKKYHSVVQQGKTYLDEEDWLFVATEIEKIFLQLTPQVVSMDRLIMLSTKMKELAEFSQAPVEPASYITILDSFNSSLYSSGDINIIGKGCIHTKIHAGGKLKISGIVRGGELYGRLGVTIHEVGAESGTKTVIAVPIDQKIHISKAYENTVLKIGPVQHVLTEERHHVRASLNQNNQIVFE